MPQVTIVFFISLILASMVSGCYSTSRKGLSENLGKDPATEDYFIKELQHSYKIEKSPSCSDPSFTLHFYVTHQYGTTSKISTYDLKRRTKIGDRFAQRGLQAGGSIIGTGLAVIGYGIQQNQNYTKEGVAIGTVGLGVALGGILTKKKSKRVNVSTKREKSVYTKVEKLTKGTLAVSYTHPGGKNIEKTYSLPDFSAGTVKMNLSDFGIDLLQSGERTYTFDLSLDDHNLGSIKANGSIDPTTYLDCLTSSMRKNLNFSKAVGIDNMLKQEIQSFCPQTSRELQKASLEGIYNVLKDFGFEHERASAYSFYIISELPCDAGRF